jgi:lysophospholipid acyltransferase (LPLAT)-like uncharacterized protein
MKDRPDSLKVALLGGAGRFLLTALMRTVRFEVRDDPAYAAAVAAGEPLVYSLWHGRLLPLAWAHRGEGVVTLISLSKDGEYIARVVQGWGYGVVRGSTSRGGSRALGELIRLAKKGVSLAVTPDGPRGPRERMKPGLLVAAQRAGRAIVPVTGACSNAWWFEGWDRFLVPKPFSRVVLVHGKPMRIPREIDEAGIERHAAELERTMRALQTQLDAELADTPTSVSDAPRAEDA